MMQQSIAVPDHFLPPTPIAPPPGTPLPQENYSVNSTIPSVPEIQSPMSIQNDSLLHARTPNYQPPQTPAGLLAPNTPLIPPPSPMYGGKNAFAPQTPNPHLQHIDDVPQLHVDHLNSILDQESHPLMENMGYDQNNPVMANMGYDEHHPPAQTPGNLSEKGQATPWNEDYEFPNSAGPVRRIIFNLIICDRNFKF